MTSTTESDKKSDTSGEITKCTDAIAKLNEAYSKLSIHIEKKTKSEKLSKYIDTITKLTEANHKLSCAYENLLVDTKKPTITYHKKKIINHKPMYLDCRMLHVNADSEVAIYNLNQTVNNFFKKGYILHGDIKYIPLDSGVYIIAQTMVLPNPDYEK
jgi:hypothetical protein